MNNRNVDYDVATTNIQKDSAFNRALAGLTSIRMKMLQLDQILVEKLALNKKSLKLTEEIGQLVGSVQKYKEE